METQRTEPPWARHYPKNIDWHSRFEGRPVAALMEEAVRRFADRPACDFLGKVWSYGELGSLVDRCALGLQQKGVGPGDRVGLLLPNCPYFVVAYFAALKLGAVVVALNPLYAERELVRIVGDAGVKTIVTLDVAALCDKLARVDAAARFDLIVMCKMTGILPFPKNLLYPIAKRKDVARLTPDPRRVDFAALAANDGRLKAPAIDPDDLAILQYTGGTTGTPKGAMLSHANLTINADQCAAWFEGAKPGRERMMGVLPFFHIFAMTVVMNLSIKLGANIIMMPRFDLAQLLGLIDKKKPTLFPAVPTIYTAIINSPDLARYDVGSVRLCFSGGAPLPVEVKQRFEKLTGCTLVEGYGLTESSPVAVANPLVGLNKAGSIGVPVPATHVTIAGLEEDGDVPQGERGEVCLAGPQIMSGYWNQPEESAQALRDGRLHTGDVGYMDEDGYVFIVDRIKDLILCGGFNVYPRNVEEAIYLHPAVAECVVGGVPDTYRGETVKAWITAAPGQTLTEAELIAFLEDKLSPIERPRMIEFRDTLPKTLIGKLDRKALLEEEAAKRG